MYGIKGYLLRLICVEGLFFVVFCKYRFINLVWKDLESLFLGVRVVMFWNVVRGIKVFKIFMYYVNKRFLNFWLFIIIEEKAFKEKFG